MGHPLCEFCRTPFYGDNELYSHMSTEHYTCHICQRCGFMCTVTWYKLVIIDQLKLTGSYPLISCRQHPGQYEYYKNYDDLEVVLLCYIIRSFPNFFEWCFWCQLKLVFLFHFRSTSAVIISCARMRAVLQKSLLFSNLKLSWRLGYVGLCRL